MIVLGVETSGPVGSLALRKDGRCIEERFLPELGRRHAQSLVPEATEFLRRHDLAPAAIDAVAVGVGPGSFTGLRVGVTFAKTFAFAAGCRVAAVDTFLAIAANTPAERLVRVIADAQRRGVMLGEYVRGDDGRFLRSGSIRLVTLDELPRLGGESDLWTGPGLGRIEPDVLRNFALGPASLRMPRASLVALLGERQIEQGEFDDAWALEPLYVRKSAAEEKREALQST